MQFAEQGHNRPATILIVEDDQSMLDGMHDLLKIADFGYDITVFQANNGRAALQLMDDMMPDLIISDVMMPKMNGYEFLEKVRENPKWIQIPFIFLTAKGAEPDIRKGKLSDADLYITKPFGVSELLSLINAQLDMARGREQARRRNIESLKKDVLQILNHEFRTPLTYVTAYYEMLANSVTEFTNNQAYQEYLRGIQAGCYRLTRLVNDFIRIVELRSGAAQANYVSRAQTIDNLATLLQEAIDAYAPANSELLYEISSEIPKKLPSIFGDPVSITNIVERLLSNAVKFTDPNQTEPNQIAVSAFIMKNEIRIVVSDQGLGFPAYMKKQIFEPFVQYNRGILEQQGAGTGLAIAQGLAKLHNGRVEAESQESVGSTFTLVLPIYNQQKLKPEQRLKFTETGQLVATVLIVEDDRNLLSGLEDLLTIFGGKYQLKVLTALNGMEALKVLEQQIPDLIISDIMMPNMGGYEFLRHVRQNPLWLHIPFIFLTARGERQDEYEGFRLGVDEYVTKPYDSDDILRFVEKQLDKHFHNKSLIAQSFEELKQGIINLITPDFRTPLASVSEMSDELAHTLQYATTEDDLKQSLQGIQESNLKLTQQVEEFISLAELKTGEAKTAHDLKAYPISNLGQLVFETTYTLKQDKRMKAWNVEMTTVSDLPKVKVDWSSLQEAIERLVIIGAQQASNDAENGEILISLHHIKSKWVEIVISYSSQITRKTRAEIAKIIANDDLDILEMPDYGSSLYIAKGYISLHGGQVIFSLKQETGFHFVIQLPVCKE